MRCNGWNALSLLFVGWATCLPVAHAQADDVEPAPPQEQGRARREGRRPARARSRNGWSNC